VTVSESPSADSPTEDDADRVPPAASGIPSRRALLPAVAALALALLFIGFLTRGTWFYLDDWDFMVLRSDWSQSALLGPQNLNWHMWTVVLYTIYGGLWGITTYLPWRLTMMALLGLIGWLVARYTQRRVGGIFAAIAVFAVLITPGTEIALWPFQMGQLISLATGIGALVLGDREGRTWRSHAAVVVLLMVTVSASSAGVPMVALVAVDRILRPGRRREVLLVLPALVLYAWWNQKWGSLSPNLPTADLPSFAGAARQSIEVGIAAVQSGLGLSQNSAYGGLVGMVGVVGLIVLTTWRMVSGVGVDRARIAALVACLVIYWTLLTWGRSTVEGYQLSPRYVFISQLLLVLLVVELLGRRAEEREAQAPRLRQQWVAGSALIAVALLCGVALNARHMRDASRVLRNEADHQHAQVAALSMLTPEQRAGAPFYRGARDMVLAIGAGAYFKPPANRGVEAIDEPEVKALPGALRAYVDQFLLAIAAPDLPADQPRPGPTGTAPVVTAGAPALVRPAANPACVVAGTVGAPPAVYAIQPPAGRLLVENLSEQPMQLRGKRYGDDIGAVFPVTAAPGSRRTLALAPDRGTTPWSAFELTVAGRARVCAIGG